MADGDAGTLDKDVARGRYDDGDHGRSDEQLQKRRLAHLPGRVSLQLADDDLVPQVDAVGDEPDQRQDVAGQRRRTRPVRGVPKTAGSKRKSPNKPYKIWRATSVPAPQTPSGAVLSPICVATVQNVSAASAQQTRSPSGPGDPAQRLRHRGGLRNVATGDGQSHPQSKVVAPGRQPATRNGRRANAGDNREPEKQAPDVEHRQGHEFPAEHRGWIVGAPTALSADLLLTSTIASRASRPYATSTCTAPA